MGPWSSCLFLPAVFCFVTPQCSESRTQKLGHWDVFSSSLFGCFGESYYISFILIFFRPADFLSQFECNASHRQKLGQMGIFELKKKYKG